MSTRLLLHRSLVAATLALAVSLIACSPSSTSKSGTSQQATPQTGTRPSAHDRARARERELNACTQKLDAIPPPSKIRYMTVKSSTHWQNPFLTIHQDSVALRIPAPSAKRTRRSRTRRTAPLWTTSKLTLDALPGALAALPENNWPYGRVIAVRDDLNGPSHARVQVRRNEEKVLSLLNNLGVVAYEWPRNRH